MEYSPPLHAADGVLGHRRVLLQQCVAATKVLVSGIKAIARLEPAGPKHLQSLHISRCNLLGPQSLYFLRQDVTITKTTGWEVGYHAHGRTERHFREEMLSLIYYITLSARIR